MSTFTPFAEKMESAGVSAAAVNAFSRCYEALVSNHSGMIPETDILPADQVEDWRDITASTPAADKDLISGASASSSTAASARAWASRRRKAC